MLRIARTVGLVFLVLLALIVCVFTYLNNKSSVAKDYSGKAGTGGTLEEKFAGTGNFTVKSVIIPVLEAFERYELWYPADMEISGESYPVVIFANGTGVKASRYKPVLEHLASWGFIVAATEETHSWNGFSAEMCLRLMIKLNEAESWPDWESNPFYGHVDLENIGISGHSQGGVGVVNAITDTRHADWYKAAFMASPTNKELAHGLEWDYDATLIHIPVLLVSGTGDGDEKLVVSLEQLREIYSDIPDDVNKVMARRSGADHGDMLTFADGYMTAWFLWQLQGNQEAAKAFTGADAEILSNSCYQDVEKNV